MKQLPWIITGDIWNHLEPSGGQPAGQPVEIKWKSNGNRKGIESASQPPSQLAGTVARKSTGNRVSRPAGQPACHWKTNENLMEIESASQPASEPASQRIKSSHPASRPAGRWRGNRMEIESAGQPACHWKGMRPNKFSIQARYLHGFSYVLLMAP